MSSVRAHVVVGGRVQGVGFRVGIRKEARRLGLEGWVCNLPAGEVEAVFEGSREIVEQAVGRCREGTPGSRVDHCDVIWGEPRGEGPFRILTP